jgi:predicted enzyme involved in methoxymalonyl-ACP biosynthesis
VLRARYRPNRKNAPARQLLERLGFSPQTSEEGFEIWVKASPGRALADIRRVVSVSTPGDA